MKRKLIAAVVLAATLANTVPVIPVGAATTDSSSVTQVGEAIQSIKFNSSEKCYVTNNSDETQTFTASNDVVVYGFKKSGTKYVSDSSRARKEYSSGEKISVFKNTRLLVVSSKQTTLTGSALLDFKTESNNSAVSYIAGKTFTLRVGDTVNIGGSSLSVPRGKNLDPNVFKATSLNTSIVTVVTGSLKVKGVKPGYANVNITNPDGSITGVKIHVINKSDATDLTSKVNVVRTGKAGVPIKFNFTLSNAIGVPFTKVQYKLKGTNKYKVGADTLSDNNRTVTFPSAGTYEWVAIAGDLRGTKEIKGEITITQPKLNANAPIVEQKTGSKGETQTIKAPATGDGDLQYKFMVTDGKGNYSILQDWSSFNTCEWKMSNVGTKYVYYHVKSSTGLQKTSEQIKVEVKDLVPITVDSFTANKKLGVKGTETKFTANVSGGKTAKLYKFVSYSVNSDGTLSAPYTMKDWSSANTLTWKFSTTGKKVIKVLVKNADGTGTVAEKTLDYAINDSDKPFINNINIDSSRIVGNPIKIKVDALSSKTGLKYKIVECTPDGKYNVLTSGDSYYSSVNSVTWTPSKEGTYKIIVHVIDKDNKHTEQTVSVKVTKPNIKGNFTASVNKNIIKGIDLTASNVSGGSSYKYEFYVCEYDSSKNVEYTSKISSGTSSKTTYLPSQAYRTYKFKCKIIDTKSGAYKVLEIPYKSYGVAAQGTGNVYDKDGKVTTTGTVGEPLTLKYQYNPSGFRFGYVVKDATGAVVESKSGLTTNVMTWTPSKSGKYTIQIKAASFENNTNTVTKTITVDKYSQAKIKAVTKDGSTGVYKDVTDNGFVPQYQNSGDTVSFELVGMNLANAKVKWYIKDRTSGYVAQQGEAVGKSKIYIQAKSLGLKTAYAEISDANGSNKRIVSFDYTVNKRLNISSVDLIKNGKSVDLTQLNANEEYIIKTSLEQVNSSYTGFGNKKYTVKVTNPSGQTTTLKENYANNTVAWKPDSKGTWKISVTAKDESGRSVTKTLSVNVGALDAVRATGLSTKTSGVEKTTFVAGESIIFTPQLSYQGNPTISYQYKYKNLTNNTSGVLHGDTQKITTRTYKRAINTPGTYEITVDVYTNGTKTSSYTKQINVVSDISNIELSGKSNASILKGSTYTYSISVDNLQADTKYKFVLRNVTKNTYTNLTADSTNPEGWVRNSGISYTFDTTGTYRIIAYAKSPNGKELKAISGDIKVEDTASIKGITISGLTNGALALNSNGYKVTLNTTGAAAKYVFEGTNINISSDKVSGFTSKEFTIYTKNPGSASFKVTAYSASGIKLSEAKITFTVVNK